MGWGGRKRTSLKEIHTPNCQKRKIINPQEYCKFAQKICTLDAQCFSQALRRVRLRRRLEGPENSGEEGTGQVVGSFSSSDLGGGGRAQPNIRAESKGLRGQRWKAGEGTDPGSPQALSTS